MPHRGIRYMYLVSGFGRNSRNNLMELLKNSNYVNILGKGCVLCYSSLSCLLIYLKRRNCVTYTKYFQMYKYAENASRLTRCQFFGHFVLCMSFFFSFAEWNVVTKEISNGSNDIQSKVVYYKAREKI